MKKLCTGCKTEKPITSFNKNKTRKDGLNGHCKSCFNLYCEKNASVLSDKKKQYKKENWDRIKVENKEYVQKHILTIKEKVKNRRLKTLYGISRKEYDLMHLDQENLCAICLSFKFVLDVDHDHKTGKVRGLLCGHCNRGLGLFMDNPLLLKEALNYLKKYEQ